MPTHLSIYINIAHLRAIVNNRATYYDEANLNLGDSYMIVFDNLWKTMKEKGVSQYKLIKTYGISTGQLDRLRKNENVNTYTLDQLCRILQCELGDIAEYRGEDSDRQEKCDV